MKLVNPPRHLVYSLAAIAALGIPAQAQATLDVRIALVIGNSACASAPLINPANDARAMSENAADVPEQAVNINSVIDAFKGAGNRALQCAAKKARGGRFHGNPPAWRMISSSTRARSQLSRN